MTRKVLGKGTRRVEVWILHVTLMDVIQEPSVFLVTIVILFVLFVNSKD